MKIRFRLKFIKLKIIVVIAQVLCLVEDVMWTLKMYNCSKHVLKLLHYCSDCRWKIYNECWGILEKAGTED